jgi:hypothetical protein
MIEDFLKTKGSMIFISIIWGLGLATLFKRSCEGNNCKVIEYRGPAISNTEYSWKYDGDDKCYKWQPYLTSCES